MRKSSLTGKRERCSREMQWMVDKYEGWENSPWTNLLQIGRSKGEPIFESCWIIRIEHLCFHSEHAKQSQKVSSNTLNSLGFGNTRSLKLYIWDTDIQIDLNLAASFSAGEVFSMGISQPFISRVSKSWIFSGPSYWSGWLHGLLLFLFGA